MSTLRDSRFWYVGLVALIALERLGELVLSSRNARRLRARGGVEFGASHYSLMVAIHVGALVAFPLEVALCRRPFLPWLGVPMIGLLVATLTLRYWVIASLGERWCTRVIVPPAEPLVAEGPYRLLRHPNYLAVGLELPALALVHSAWGTGAFFGGANLLVLWMRIRVEDEALGRSPQFGGGGPA